METLRIFITPVLMAVIGLAIIFAKKLHPKKDLGLQAPSLKNFLIWLACFIALATIVEVVSGPFGQGSARGTWIGKYNPTQLAIRLVAVPLLYPIVEEFFFRGVMLGAINKRFGAVPAIAASSLAFALAHTQYSVLGMALILMDGIFFGVCRLRTGSLFLPMLFHILGNSFAVWQRLTP